MMDRPKVGGSASWDLGRVSLRQGGDWEYEIRGGRSDVGVINTCFGGMIVTRTINVGV